MILDEWNITEYSEDSCTGISSERSSPPKDASRDRFYGGERLASQKYKMIANYE